MMNVIYGKPVILLIDEYDVPLAKADANGYYPQMLDLIRGMMSTSLKTNDYLKFAVVTGCLRIPKESIFTGVNNFASYSVLDNDFAQYFGFIQNEVDQMLAEFELSDKKEIILEWYDGYMFGKQSALTAKREWNTGVTGPSARYVRRDTRRDFPVTARYCVTELLFIRRVRW